MATSIHKTPIKSHITRRKSNFVEKSPLRKSIPNTSTPIMQHIVNDDEAERARRRSCSELQKRVSNIGVLNRSITGINASDSESCVISEASLEDHYQTCVKLFTENKINTKNAWNLHIIEFMRAMLKKGLVMRETLKLASTSLDIGSKVYGLRVDDIHSDIFKLASAMARINMDLEKNKENEDENDDDQESGDTEENAAEKKKKQKKKLVRRSCDDESAELMIAKDEKSLNGEITPHNTQYTGAATSGKDKLYTISILCKQNCGWEQLVNCRTNFNYWTPVENEKEKETPAAEPVPVTFPNAEGVLCPSFMDFVIDQWSPDDDDVPLSTQQARAKADEIVYDENGLPIPELDASIPDINDNNFENDGFDNLGDDIEEEVGAGLAGARPPVAFITDMRPGDGPVSDKPLQYSYRAAPVMSDRYTITGVWAGPSHWKIKCLQRRTSGQVSVQSVPQKGRRAPRMGPQIIDFETRFDEEFDQQFVPSRKKLTRTRNHLHSLDKFTLPEDMCITKDDLCRLSLRPWLKQPIGGTEAMQLKTAASADLNISTVYQYDNPNDADYCSQSMTQNDADAAADDDTGDDQAADNNDVPNFTQHEFGDDNMVDMPNIVQKTFVPYATQAKKMDMKKLKDAIWKSMAFVHSGDDSVLENEAQLKVTNLDHVSFGDMFKILPKHMSARMGDELSCPLAFVALLHLANEQTLKLEGQPDLLDLLISTDK